MAFGEEVHCCVDDSASTSISLSLSQDKPLRWFTTSESIVLFYNAENLINKKIIEKI